MTIGIFGGSFNPPHFGHLNLAIEMLESGCVSEILFSPAFISPLKQNQPQIAIEHRLAMLKLALEKFPHASILELESQRGGVSYTIDTILALKKLYPQKSFALILGEDALTDFTSWHQPEEIVKQVPVFIGLRQGAQLPHDIEEYPLLKTAFEKGRINTRMLNISSTEIRNRLEQKLYCRHLLPAKVVDYIESHQLYS